MLLKNLVFHCSERDVAEDIMNTFENIIDKKAKKMGVKNPNVSTNISYDYSQNAFFVHLRSDLAFNGNEHSLFSYIIEYLYFTYEYNILTENEFRKKVEEIRTKNSFFKKKSKLSKLNMNELSNEKLFELDSFFRHGEITYNINDTHENHVKNEEGE